MDGARKEDECEIPVAARRLRLAGDLFDLAYELKSHQLRLRHPDWDEERLRRETVRRIQEANA